MDSLTFDKLLLQTAFCCMACDGSIEDVEIRAIKAMCEKSSQFDKFNFENELNIMINDLNEKGKDYLNQYFETLDDADMSEEEELKLIEFAIGTLRANQALEYSEIKFFKVIRLHLRVSNEKVLEVFPDIEPYLEEDVITDSYLDKIKAHYLESAALPKFEKIKLPGDN